MEAQQAEVSDAEIRKNLELLEDEEFVHLHNHTQFSVLQSTIDVKDLVRDAAKNNMPAVAMTDHANMMGAFEFVKAVGKHNSSLKPERSEEHTSELQSRCHLVCRLLLEYTPQDTW